MNDSCYIDTWFLSGGGKSYSCTIHGYLGGEHAMVNHVAANAERQIPRLDALIEAEAILKESRDASKS